MERDVEIYHHDRRHDEGRTDEARDSIICFHVRTLPTNSKAELTIVYASTTKQ